MENRTYCFNRCLSISHSNDGTQEHMHVHTVEIGVYIASEDVLSVLECETLEKRVQGFLDRYNESCLNDRWHSPEHLTIEYLGETIFYEISDTISGDKFCVQKVTISETPLRTYTVARAEV